jgi:acetoin utilization protein AcuC
MQRAGESGQGRKDEGKDGPLVLIYGDELASAEYTESHPFRPVRAKLFMELLHRYFSLQEDRWRIERPEPLDEELLYLYHDRSYIELLKKAGNGEFLPEMLSAGLGTDENPIFKSMFELARTVAGGTLKGARLLFEGEAAVVFDPISGLHHAKRDHASGFCYVNDVVVAIADLVRKGARVASIDIDVHHGDGVQEAFYATDRVLTISLHESGKTLFPGTGFETEIGVGEGRGFNVNVPLAAGTDDEIYLSAFEDVVPPLVERFRPDIVFAQIGADTHREDCLAHLNLTSRGYTQAVSRIKALSPSLMAMGGGGYNIFKTAALWTLAWSVLSGVEPQDKFTGLVGGMMYGPEAKAGSLEDFPFALESREREECAGEARRVVAYLRETVFPLHGL